jgi:hypothetical protein
MDLSNILAIYSPIIGTLAFALSLILGINELLKDKPRIRVKIKYGNIMSMNGESSESLFIFEIHNIGRIPNTISSCGWFHPDKTSAQWLVPYDLTLPYELMPHKIVNAYFAKRWLLDYKITDNISGFFVKDEEGKMWTSNFNKKQQKDLLTYSQNDYLIIWNEKSHNYSLQKIEDQKRSL